MLYLIGLGLGDVRDITVKGLDAIKRCSRVYLESYTSVLCYGVEKEELVSQINFFNLNCRKRGRLFFQERFYGKELILADREFVESNSGKFTFDKFSAVDE